MFSPRVSPRMVRFVTLLPHPDSPTMPRVLPGSTANETPSTARPRAVVGVELDAQVLDLEEGAAIGKRTRGSR